MNNAWYVTVFIWITCDTTRLFKFIRKRNQTFVLLWSILKPTI